MKNAIYFLFYGQILTFQNLGQSENRSKALILKEGPHHIREMKDVCIVSSTVSFCDSKMKQSNNVNSYILPF